MKLAVITPVGPGHGDIVDQAIASVTAAQVNFGRFTEIDHVIVDDQHGLLGRGRARNIGMKDADWYFFLDADDQMTPDALTLCNFDHAATFGLVSLSTKRNIKAPDIYPCGWRELATHGASGTLTMGFFCRADIARALRFNETMNVGEDFDFYLRLPDFIKIDRPLSVIGYDLPSAGGPRGYQKTDWHAACSALIAAAKAKDPEKYDLSGDAILEPGRSARPKS